MNKIYIAGKVSGEDYETVKSKFYFVEQKLIHQRSDIFIINPTKFVKKTDSWAKAMKISIKLLVSCDEVYLIKDYSSSRGAIIEYFIARIIGLKIIRGNDNFHYKKNLKNIILLRILNGWLKIFKK